MQARFNGRYELSVASKKQALFAGLSKPHIAGVATKQDSLLAGNRRAR